MEKRSFTNSISNSEVLLNMNVSKEQRFLVGGKILVTCYISEVHKLQEVYNSNLDQAPCDLRASIHNCWYVNQDLLIPCIRIDTKVFHMLSLLGLTEHLCIQLCL